MIKAKLLAIEIPKPGLTIDKKEDTIEECNPNNLSEITESTFFELLCFFLKLSFSTLSDCNFFS